MSNTSNVPVTGKSHQPPPERVSTSALSDQDWMLSILRPVLVAVMAVCLVMAMTAFVRRLAPDLPVAYTWLLTVIGAVASLVGSATTTWLAQPGQRASRSAGVRAAELALVLGGIRIASWLATDSWPGLEFFLLRPLVSLMDGYFLVAVFVIGLAWANSTAMTDDLLALGLQPDDLYSARTFNDRWQDTARPVYTDRPAILRRFVGRWVVGGVILVILAAGSRYDLPENGFLGAIRQNIDPTVITAIIIYFLAGLVLISQATNLIIFLAAGLTRGRPPLVPEGETVLPPPFADPVPQALILTAIVISFGVIAFAIVLFQNVYLRVQSDDLDQMKSTDA